MVVAGTCVKSMTPKPPLHSMNCVWNWIWKNIRKKTDTQRDIQGIYRNLKSVKNEPRNREGRWGDTNMISDNGVECAGGSGPALQLPDGLTGRRMRGAASRWPVRKPAGGVTARNDRRLPRFEFRKIFLIKKMANNSGLMILPDPKVTRIKPVCERCMARRKRRALAQTLYHDQMIRPRAVKHGLPAAGQATRAAGGA